MDNITEGPEEYFLFLEGTRNVLILTPMVTVTILDAAGEFCTDFTGLFLVLICNTKGVLVVAIAITTQCRVQLILSSGLHVKALPSLGLQK